MTIGADSATEMNHHDASSLASLSRRFLEYVSTCNNGVIDLNDMAKRLNAHKRRVYDITNVLEGIDLLEKISKNNVRYTPSIPYMSPESESRAEELRRKIRLTEAEIEEVDQRIEVVHAQLRAIGSDEIKKRLYLTKRDILNLAEMKGRRCYAVQVPEGAQIQKLIIPDSTKHTTSYELRIKCDEGVIKVTDLGSGGTQNKRRRYDSESEGSPEGCKENHS